MSKILFATDMDGTLLNSNGEISVENKKEIKAFVEKGNYFVLTTGRPGYRTDEFTKELGIYSSDQFGIFFNGAVIESTDHTKIITELYLNDEDAYEIIKYGENLGTGLFVYTKDFIYVRRFPSFLQPIKEMEHVKMDTSFCDLLKLKKIIKIIFVNTEDFTNESRLHLPQDYFNRFTVVQSTKYYLEFFRKEINKGIALTILRDKLKIKEEDTYGAGDEENDLELLMLAKTGIAVKNANPKLLEIADEVTLDCDHSGIAYALKNIVRYEK